MSGPLHGFRIMELGAIGPAPFAGALLADLGADVVRIDRIPHADAPPDLPPRFDFYNRNKRSVALDLKQPAAVRTLLQLLPRANALVEGFRPGVAERLGLGPQACLEANPRLIYGRMTGWGQDGPLAQEAGHDINYLAMSGALYCIGGADRPPPPPLNLVADLGGGALYLAVGILSAAFEVQNSGRGQVVDAAMLDGVTNLMSAFQAFSQFGSWTTQRSSNVVDGGAPYYGTYETQDGKFIAVGAMEPQFYEALLRALGLADESLPAQNDRSAWPKMRERFAAIFHTRTCAEWIEATAGRDACLSPVLTIDEAAAHPHMHARKVYADFDGVRHPSPAPRFDRTPATLRRPAPAAGQHSREVLNEWGLSEADIAALESSMAMVQS
ncbi:MAG: carnitine dehydratase [Tardiphaga sp.]|nr:carnitine dehydratase [Tardiphaga sp.]